MALYVPHPVIFYGHSSWTLNWPVSENMNTFSEEEPNISIVYLIIIETYGLNMVQSQGLYGQNKLTSRWNTFLTLDDPSLKISIISDK